MKQEIELTLNEQGELKVKQVEDKSSLAVLIKDLARLNCDKVDCENCSLDCGHHGCALQIVEKELMEMLLR